MRPEVVVVKAFGGIALNRWMLGHDTSVADITNEAGAAAAAAGREPEHVVGFPIADVYRPPEIPVRDGETPDWDEFIRRIVLQ
jgi:hypothetical protein